VHKGEKGEGRIVITRSGFWKHGIGEIATSQGWLWLNRF